jgi:RNA polymerase sigma factor (sigma-70 family)
MTKVTEPAASAAEPLWGWVGAVIDEHDSALRRFLRRWLSDPQEISDVTQEVYLRLMRGGSPGKLNDNARAYVFTTAVNLVRDRRRRERARHFDRHVSLEEAESVTCPTQSPEENAQWLQQVELLKAALRGLEPRYRQVFVLHKIMNRTYPEIAAEMGVCVRTVERYLTIALAHCRAKLKV